MNCNFANKVSMLIDGELSAAESERVRTHLAGCAECQHLEKDFLFFREQIKESAADFSETEKFQIPTIPIRKQTPFWNKWISLPAPIAALFVFALFGLGTWLILSSFRQISNDSAIKNPVINTSSKPENQSNEVSLARFDRGGRAEIYVVPQRAE